MDYFMQHCTVYKSAQKYAGKSKYAFLRRLGIGARRIFQEKRANPQLLPASFRHTNLAGEIPQALHGLSKTSWIRRYEISSSTWEISKESYRDSYEKRYLNRAGWNLNPLLGIYSCNFLHRDKSAIVANKSPRIGETENSPAATAEI